MKAEKRGRGLNVRKTQKGLVNNDIVLHYVQTEQRYMPFGEIEEALGRLPRLIMDIHILIRESRLSYVWVQR